MINYISCNYLIQTTEQLKKPPITKGIHVQNISMTKGTKSEKQKKDKKVKKKRMNQTKRKKKNKTKEKTKKERKKNKHPNKTNKKQPLTYIYSARSGTERL